MSLLWQSQPRPILSPCIGVCVLDQQNVCEGCLRLSDEIARWSIMSDAERLHIMNTVLPEREARRNEL